MGSGCSTESNAAVVDSSSNRRVQQQQRSSDTRNNDQETAFGASFLTAYHTPSPRLLQYLATGNNNVMENDEDESSTEEITAYSNHGRLRDRRRSVSGGHQQTRRSLQGFAQRRRNRRLRHEEDVRFAEVLALQQSLAAMEDFFQSLLSHSHLLLEVMDPAVVDSSGGPPPASQVVLRNLPRRRWCEVQTSKQEAQHVTDEQNDAIENACCETHGGNKSIHANTSVQDCTECGVCFELHQDDDMVVELPCGHVYHVDCVEDWLQRHCTCPSCRYELPTDDIMYERGRKERMKQRTASTSTTSPATPSAATVSAAASSPSREAIPSSHRMRNVMSESPSSWYIDHLQSRGEDDPSEEYNYGRYHYRSYHTPSSFTRHYLQSTTPPVATETEITMESNEEDESNTSVAAPATDSAFGAPVALAAGEIERNSADCNGLAQDESKIPAVRPHFPQQDTCAGIDGLDTISTCSYAGIRGTSSTAMAFSCDSEDGTDD